MAWFNQHEAQLAHAIEREVDALHRVASRLTGSSSAAEDLVQETCLRAWRARRSVREQREFRPWLFRILRNLWIDELRKTRRTPILVELTANEDEAAIPETPVMPPSDIADRKQLERWLDREIIAALDDLTEHERLALLFHAFADMNYHEIATALECPLGTVMSRLHRARAKLRERLACYARTRGIVRASTDTSAKGGAASHGNA